MDEDLLIRGSLVVPASELSWRFSRASGPGGQGVNTTDSRVELVFDLSATHALPEDLRRRALERLAPRLANGVLTVVASSERSQLQNRLAARRRLAEILASAIAPPPPPRRRTAPSRASVERRLASKRHRGRIKKLRRDRED